MSLKILVVAATQTEADIVKSVPGILSVTGGYKFHGCEIIPLVTGVGSVSTAWAMTKIITSGSKADLALNIGIAGSYRDDIKPGEVVCPVSDLFADAGINTGKGFLTLAEAGLENPDAYPFRSGKIFAENSFSSAISLILRPVNAITVNTATGSGNIRIISERYNPDIETMEGAAFFYVCSRENIPFAAIRSVSNRVEPIRDKRKWDIPAALNNLSETFKDVLLML
jgi:futalosine hydrolase